MNITRDIIIDLLPLYVSGECSPDTKQLVDKYLKDHPDLGQRAQEIAANPLPAAIPRQLKNGDEIKSLKKTRKRLKVRSVILAFALFFSLVPFSFGKIDGRSFFMIMDSPNIAIAYGSIGIGFWIVYFMMRRKMSL